MGFVQAIADNATGALLRVTEKFGLSGQGVAHVAQYPSFLGTSDGAYSLGVVSGTMAASLAAGSEIFQFRWTSTTTNAQIQNITFSAVTAGTAFAAGVGIFSAAIARSWSVQGTAGTGVTIGTSNKRRTSFASSNAVAGDIRVATTGALGAGTKTIDTNSFAQLIGNTGTATTGQIVPTDTIFWSRPNTDAYPIFLTNTDGIVIRATVPITGTWTFAVGVDWTEQVLANY